MAESLFYAVMVGMALGVLFDVFRLFRLVFNDKFFFDFLFWIISAIVTFCYLLIFNNGQVRSIYFVFISVGFLLVILSLGCVSKPIQQKVAKKIKKQLKSFKKVLQNIYIILYNKLSYFRALRVKARNDKNGRKNKKQK